MKNLIMPLLLAFMLVACKNTSTEQTTDQSATNEEISTFAERLAERSLDVRKPGDVSDLLQLSGTRFMPELVNDPMNFEQYKSDDVKAAANIGVYMVDGLYQVAFEKPYDGYMSIAAAKQLAIELGIGDIMSEIVLERYGDGEHPGDSILNLIGAGITSSEDALTQRNQEQIFAAMLVGNYIEKLHILFTNIFEYPIDLPEESKVLILRDLLLITTSELDLLPDAIALVEKYKKDKEGYLLKELKEIQEIRSAHQLTTGQMEKLEHDMIFKNEALLAIYEKIKVSRSFIVATK